MLFGFFHSLTFGYLYFCLYNFYQLIPFLLAHVRLFDRQLREVMQCCLYTVIPFQFCHLRVLFLYNCYGCVVYKRFSASKMSMVSVSCGYKDVVAHKQCELWLRLIKLKKFLVIIREHC